MIQKLLFRNQDRKQLIIAVLGAFMGITFLIASVHYLIRLNEFGQGSEILGPNTLIVQKKVTNSTSLALTKNDFTEREIQKIEELPFIEKVKPVVSNNFDVSFETADPLVPRFRSDVFVQTVDPTFLDVHSKKWHWKEGDAYVPIIMPRDFLVMLNTFMSASNIPQISDDLAMDIRFKFTISNQTKKVWVDARIIGFTNEVSSILVPESFMEYGNQQFSLGVEKKITQLMISGKENEFGKVEALLKEKGLESKNAQMVAGRLKSVIGTLLLVVMGISVIAVFLSGLVLIQYMQLLMSKNEYEVRTLMRIGYAPRILIRSFFIYFVRIFGIIAGLGLASFFVMKYFLDEMFTSGGIYLNTSISVSTFIVLALVYVTFSVASYRTAAKGIHRHF
ncbi:MAG: hypothetical protein RL632_434 [Bacteroidota bacterium]